MSKAVLEAVYAAIGNENTEAAAHVRGIVLNELNRLSLVMASETIEWNFDIDACPMDVLVIVSTAPSDKAPQDAKRVWSGKKVTTKETARGWRFNCLATQSTPLAWAFAPKHVLEILG